MKEVFELCLREIPEDEKANFPIFEGISQVEMSI